MTTLNVEQKAVVKSVRAIFAAEKTEAAAAEKNALRVTERYTAAAKLLAKQVDTKLDPVAQIKQVMKEFKATLTVAKIPLGSKTPEEKKGSNLLAEMKRRVTVMLYPDTEFMRVVKRVHSGTTVETPMTGDACVTAADFQDAAKQVNENLGISKPKQPKAAPAVVQTDDGIVTQVHEWAGDKLKVLALLKALRAEGFTVTPPKDATAAMTKAVSAPSKRKSTKKAKTV